MKSSIRTTTKSILNTNFELLLKKFLPSDKILNKGFVEMRAKSINKVIGYD